MSPGERLAEAAESLVGTRFRLHGRDPASGLDCVGLVTCALTAIGQGAGVPATYGLRNSSIASWLPFAEKNGLMPVGDGIRRGDVLLLRPGPGQCHLVIALCGDEFVHAHAGLGRVVLQTGPLDWPLLHHWRLGPQTKDI